MNENESFWNRLTPFAKAILIGGILLAAGGAVWTLGVGDLITGSGETEAANNDATPTEERPGLLGNLLGSGGAAPSGPLGSETNPIVCNLVSFHGYAPALVANQNPSDLNAVALETQAGSIYEKLGVHVKFVIDDHVPLLPDVFANDEFHCIWRTSDFFAQEHPGLRSRNLDGRGILIVDNTQGADAIVVKDPNVKTFEDLVGHSIALVQASPSDMMFLDARANSSLSGRAKSLINVVYVPPEDGTPTVREYYEQGKVDAMALWDPDLSLGMVNVPGSHVIYSTENATNLIYDVMVFNERVLANPDNRPAIQAFVDGWLAGIKAAEANPDRAVAALKSSEPLFADLAKAKGDQFVRDLFTGPCRGKVGAKPCIDWTDLADNARIMGLAGDINQLERVYAKADRIYREAGYTVPANAPVIAPNQAFDYSFIQDALTRDSASRVAAAKPAFTFTAEERAQAVQNTPVITKPVFIEFASGSADLDRAAIAVLEDEAIGFLEDNGGAYIRIEGGTDSQGSDALNRKLSALRARAVRDNLVRQQGFNGDKFDVVGSGEDNPLCDESNPEAEGLTLAECMQRNRTVRIVVLGR